MSSFLGVPLVVTLICSSLTLGCGDDGSLDDPIASEEEGEPADAAASAETSDAATAGGAVAADAAARDEISDAATADEGTHDDEGSGEDAGIESTGPNEAGVPPNVADDSDLNATDATVPPISREAAASDTVSPQDAAVDAAVPDGTSPDGAAPEGETFDAASEGITLDAAAAAVTAFEGSWVAVRMTSVSGCGDGNAVVTEEPNFAIELRAGEDFDLEYIEYNAIGEQTCVNQYDVEGTIATLIGEQDCTYSPGQVVRFTSSRLELVSQNELHEEGVNFSIATPDCTMNYALVFSRS